jgi:hypothetical protein
MSKRNLSKLGQDYMLKDQESIIFLVFKKFNIMKFQVFRISGTIVRVEPLLISMVL